jgi:single-strand DNA-binding protein
MNRATILGYLGADPEIRNLNEGGRVASFSIATTDKWKDRENGEERSATEWHRISCFSEPLIDLIEKSLRKGSKILIEGSLHTRKWTDKDQIDRYTTEIVLRPYSGSLTLLDAPRAAPEPTKPAPRGNPRRPTPSTGPRAA